MAVLEIARMGNPVLRSVANPVDLRELVVPGGEIQTLIDDIIDTIRSANSVGLAAPQVSRPLQIAVIEWRGDPRFPKIPVIPLTVLVNPVITTYSNEQISAWESCFSLPGLLGWVPRQAEVTVEAFNREGEKYTVHGDGFFAKALQHEIDHLNGILYVDRITDFTRFMYEEEFGTWWDGAKLKHGAD